MRRHNVLVRPVVTEKSMLGSRSLCFAFQVVLDANKIDVKGAVETYYGVKVVGVRTLVVRGKFRRSGRSGGKQGNWKKAYVQLAEGQTISLFEN